MVKIIKETLKVLNEKNISATPKNYANEFYKQCKKSNILIEDVIEINKFIDGLSLDEKKHIDKNEVSYYEISKILNKRFKDSDLMRFVYHLKSFFKPSIDQKINKEIDDFFKILLLNTKNLTSNVIIRKLNIITKKRIDNDRNVIIKKSNDIYKISTLLGKYFDNSLLQSNNSIEELSNIKSEISNLNLSKESYREVNVIQSNLINTVYKLEYSLQKNNTDLKKGQISYKALEHEIKFLKETLKKVELEKEIDFLTGITNRRGFDNEVKIIEHKYSHLKQMYALIFFDIDFFKRINDEYGHKCGDSVISTFASILKSLTRTNDIVSRYGGEEFVALINYTKKNEIEKYIKRVKSIVRENSFIYQELKFKIKFSAGVTYRESYETFEGALTKADELLYVAKNTGRDKIVFDTNVIV